MKINGIIGKKLGMSLIYDDSGNMLPVTLVQAGPCTVTQVKTLAKDGYDSVQIGFSESKNLNSPQSGHQKRSGGQFSVLQEFQADEVSGTTKGRGFSGGVRRYGFKGGPKTHGQSDRHRAVGSIGAGSSPGRVWPGTRMPGHYGNEKATIKGLSIAKIDSKNNILVIKGSIPGHNGSNVRIEIQN